MIIDFHTHTFPDKIADAALSKLRAASHTLSFTDGTVTGLKRSMKEASIDWSVVLPVATNPLKVESINDLSAALTERDGLVYFGCIHPDMENPKEEIARIVKTIKNWKIPVTGTQGFGGAQVTAGGIAATEIDPSTFAIKRLPGVYAAGEVLDVDGDCGGFNLQFAWSSAYVAAKSIAEKQ